MWPPAASCLSTAVCIRRVLSRTTINLIPYLRHLEDFHPLRGGKFFQEYKAYRVKEGLTHIYVNVTWHRPQNISLGDENLCEVIVFNQQKTRNRCPLEIARLKCLCCPLYCRMSVAMNSVTNPPMYKAPNSFHLSGAFDP